MADKDSNIQLVTADTAKRTLTRQGLMNVLWILVSQSMNRRVVLKRKMIKDGIPRDAVLQVEYSAGDDVYVITAARQRPKSDIVVPN